MSQDLSNKQENKKAEENNYPFAKTKSKLQPKTVSRLQPKLFDLKKDQNTSSNSQMPEEVQTKMESSFGQDFSNVNIHPNSDQAKNIGAKAYAQGNDIHFAPGQYEPNSKSGQELLGHELTHVVQQGQGKVGQGEVHGKGLEINTDSSLEKEADEMGKMASEGKTVDIQHVSPLSIQRVGGLYQPIVKAAPPTAMTITNFIKLVEAEEAKYPPAEQVDTKLMITRFRKIYYNTNGWNKYLIQGTDSVSQMYKTSEKETGRYNIDPDGLMNSFDVVTKTPTATDAAGKTPDIFKNQEIQLDKGSYKNIGLDIGHVFAGLDAINNSNPVNVPLSSIGITSNLDAATWVGDLGSVMAELLFKFWKEDRPLSTTEAQAIVNEYASPQDMLGNIDAYVIGRSYNMDTSSVGKKVSDILKEYYLGDTGQAAMNREKRYSIFAKEVGLTGWTGSSFSNESEWIDYYVDEVNDSAALYTVVSTDSLLATKLIALGVSMNSMSENIVKTYLDALKTAISTE